MRLSIDGASCAIQKQKIFKNNSLEVAMVAHNLAALKNEYFGGNVDINKVAVIAMYHEVSEIFTGDMPTPIKYFDPKLRELYGEVETLAQEKNVIYLARTITSCL